MTVEPQKKGGHISSTPGTIANADGGFGFGAHRAWVYAKRVGGRFQRLHRWSGILLVGFLLVVPWLRVGGLPAARIDLPARTLTLLGMVFTATDGFNIVLVALLAAFSLFFWTALLGRVWCGYLCPQTVFLEEWIRPIENLIEGDRGARMRRDGKGFSMATTARKAVKFTIFGVLAILLGITVMSWFAGAPEIWLGKGGPMDYTMAGVIGFVFFWDWAWFREQACNYICPYARFQGALTDEHSLVVSYDETRGEPRKKGKLAAEEDHCVDCGECVRVCPAGIDIREGFQLECINCARCIDACSGVMAKFEKPTLVHYTTIAAEEGKKTRWIRPRTVVYVGILTALTAFLAFRVTMRSAFDVTVNRAPGELFQVDADGLIRNTFFVNVGNNDPHDLHHYEIKVLDFAPDEVIYSGADIASGQVTMMPLVLRENRADIEQTTHFTIQVTDELGHSVEAAAIFKAPHGAL